MAMFLLIKMIAYLVECFHFLSSTTNLFLDLFNFFSEYGKIWPFYSQPKAAFLSHSRSQENWALFLFQTRKRPGAMVFGLGSSRPERHRSVVCLPCHERVVRSGALPDRTVGSYRGPFHLQINRQLQTRTQLVIPVPFNFFGKEG